VKICIFTAKLASRLNIEEEFGLQFKNETGVIKNKVLEQPEKDHNEHM